MPTASGATVVVTSSVGDGEEGIFELMDHEHTAIANFLGAIAAARDAGHASELFSEMIAAARAHFEKEEQVAFPRAEQRLGTMELKRLAYAWADARGVAIEVPV